MKQAWRSYLASIHPRNVKKLKERAPGWWVYALIIGLNLIPAILLEGSPQNWTASYILLLLPMFFMTWSDLNSKYLMSKPLFLCPMKKEEREEYIRCVLICKISGVLVAGVLVWIIWCMDYGVQIWRLGMMLFIYASAGIASYISYEYPITEIGQKTPWVTYDKDGKKIYPHLGSILICAVFIEMGAFGFCSGCIKSRKGISIFCSRRKYCIYSNGDSRYRHYQRTVSIHHRKHWRLRKEF